MSKPVARKIPIDAKKVDAILDGILNSDLIASDVVNAYGVSLIMAMLFEPLSMGEKFNNAAYQLARCLGEFDIDPMQWQAELAPLYKKFRAQLDAAQKRRQMEMIEQAKAAMKDTAK